MHARFDIADPASDNAPYHTVWEFAAKPRRALRTVPYGKNTVKPAPPGATTNATTDPTGTMTTERKTRTQLDRNDWIQGATEVLAEKGVDGLRVEVLAKNFGVTKGSFYWHFRDRQDLLDAVLDNWREGRLRDIEKQTSGVAGSALEQIHHVVEVYSANRNRKGMAIELAVRDWARRDARAAAVVEAVDTYRLDCTRKVFTAAGVPDAEARARSILVFAYVFGHSLMAYDRSDPQLPQFRRWITDCIVGR